MKNKINESIKFLLLEYNRLKKKYNEKKISSSEKETFKKLKKFLGKQK